MPKHLSDAIRVFNDLKRRRVIRDYAIVGAVAAAAYLEPIRTQDLDITILAETDEEYIEAFRGISDAASKVKGMGFIYQRRGGPGIPKQH